MSKLRAAKQELLTFVYLAVACAAALLTGTATSSSAMALNTKSAQALYCKLGYCFYFNFTCTSIPGGNYCNQCDYYGTLCTTSK